MDSAKFNYCDHFEPVTVTFRTTPENGMIKSISEVPEVVGRVDLIGNLCTRPLLHRQGHSRGILEFD